MAALVLSYNISWSHTAAMLQCFGGIGIDVENIRQKHIGKRRPMIWWHWDMIFAGTTQLKDVQSFGSIDIVTQHSPETHA